MTEKEKSNRSGYVVLRRSAPAAAWNVVGAFEATSADAAIRVSVASAGDAGEYEYVAVPGRSWKPVVVKSEIQTKITLEPATAATALDPVPSEPPTA